MAWTEVMRPSAMPLFSWMTLVKGDNLGAGTFADNLELSYFSWFTTIINMGALAEGAERRALLPLVSSGPMFSSW